MKKIKLILKLSFLYFRFQVIVFILLNSNALAQGNVNISPGRVIFEGQKKIMELNVNNDSQDSAKYSISFVQIRMTEDGTFQWITSPDPGQKFADKYIRVFPRLVRLGPHDTQIVRLQLTRGDQLEQGEYRSHLYFKSLISQKALNADDIKKDSNFLLNIEINFGITIPVIIRVGESTTNLTITDLNVEKGKDGSRKLNLELHRTGNMSLYGEVSVSNIAPNGKETKIGFLKDVAVYTPNSLLKVHVDLNTKPDFDLSNGIIHVVFSTKSGANIEKIADAKLSLK